MSHSVASSLVKGVLVGGSHLCSALLHTRICPCQERVLQFLVLSGVLGSVFDLVHLLESKATSHSTWDRAMDQQWDMLGFSEQNGQQQKRMHGVVCCWPGHHLDVAFVAGCVLPIIDLLLPLAESVRVNKFSLLLWGAARRVRTDSGMEINVSGQPSHQQAHRLSPDRRTLHTICKQSPLCCRVQDSVILWGVWTWNDFLHVHQSPVLHWRCCEATWGKSRTGYRISDPLRRKFNGGEAQSISNSSLASLLVALQGICIASAAQSISCWCSLNILHSLSTSLGRERLLGRR